MKNIIEKLNTLSSEAACLWKQHEALEQEKTYIENRLLEINGAIQALNEILNDLQVESANIP